MIVRRALNLFSQLSWSGLRRSTRSRKPRALQGNRLQFEPLEERQLLSVNPTEEFMVNSFTTGTQSTRRSSQSVAMDNDGNYVVTWESADQDGSGLGVFAQRFEPNGTPRGSEFQVNTTTSRDQAGPAIAMDADGDFVVTWIQYQDDPGGRGYGVYAQRFDASGSKQGSEFRVSRPDARKVINAAIAMDPDGDFVVTWSNTYAHYSNNSFDVSAQRYNAQGVPQGSEFFVFSPWDAAQHGDSSVAMDADGNFVVAWTAYTFDGNGYDIYAQRFAADGTAQGSEFRVNSTVSNVQHRPQVAMDASGDFLIAWQQGMNFWQAQQLQAQRYAADGTPQGSEFRVDQSTLQLLSIGGAFAEADSFAITWTNVDYDRGHEVRVRRYNLDGTPRGSEFSVSSLHVAEDTKPSIAMSRNGNFVVAWSPEGYQLTNQDVYARSYVGTIEDVRVAGATSAIEESERLVSTIPSGPVLQITFRNAVSIVGGASGTSSVTNPANWSLMRDGVDVSDQITSIQFSNDIATLTLASPLASGAITLTAKETILDVNGAPIDGDSDGTPGGDFVRHFKISPPVALESEFRVNTYTTDRQWNYRENPKSVATNARGDFVVTWTSQGQDGFNEGVYGQRYSANGAAIGTEFRVNAYTTGTQYRSSVALADTGEFVITWTDSVQDGNLEGAYARYYDSNGVSLLSFRVSPTRTGAQDLPQVAMDANGQMLFVWSGYEDGLGYGLWGRFVTVVDSQAQLSSPFSINEGVTYGGTPSVAMDDDGDFVVAWQGAPDLTSGVILARRFDSAGAPRGSAFVVNTTVYDPLTHAVAATDAAGNFVITWEVRLGPNSLVRARRFDASGAPLGDEFLVYQATSPALLSPVVSNDADGDFVIAWETRPASGNQGGAILARRYDASGNPQGSEFQINTTTANLRTIAAVAMDRDGDFVVAWTSSDKDGSDENIYARKFVESVPTTRVALDAGGNLTIADVSPGGQTDRVTISSDTANSRFIITDPTHLLMTDIAGASGNGSQTISVPFSLVSGPSIAVSGQSGDDSLTIDYSLGNFTKNIVFDGGNSSLGDKLLLTGASFASVEHVFSSAADGNVTIAGNALVSYNSVESAVDSLIAQQRTIQLPTVSTNIVDLSDDGIAANGTSRLSGGNIPTLDFSSTSGTLRLLRGSASDSLSTGNLPDFGAGLVIGASGSEFNQLTFGGNLTLAAGNHLTAFASGSILFPYTYSDVATTGTGSISLTTSRNIDFASGSSLTTANGDLSLSANQQTVADTGNFTGVRIRSATVQITGSGNLSVAGRGGNPAGNIGSQIGVSVQSGGSIKGGMSGSVYVLGKGGGTIGSSNYGVEERDLNTLITSGGADVYVTGNGGGSDSTSRDNVGVRLVEGRITAAGNGSIVVRGVGGLGTGIGHIGVRLQSSIASISSANGNVTVLGAGGGTFNFLAQSFNQGVSSYGQINAGGMGNVYVYGTGGRLNASDGHGILLDNSTSRISSAGGDVYVGGQGSPVTVYGVVVTLGAKINAGGLGKVLIEGTGNQAIGGVGVSVSGSGTQITSGGGDVEVRAVPTSGTQGAISISSSAAITTSTSGGNITLIADTMTLSSTVAAGSLATALLRPYTDHFTINLGITADTVPGQLGLSSSELNQISGGTIRIGHAASGNIAVTSNITRSSPGEFVLATGGNIAFTGGTFNTGGGNLTLSVGPSGSILPTYSGTDVTTSANSTLSLAPNANITLGIHGATGNTAYDQLRVSGLLNLTGSKLKLTGSYVPVNNDAFTLVDNDGTDPIVGTFAGLPEGAHVNFNGADLQITYVGGSGNDVELRRAGLAVTSIAPTSNGFVVEFDQPFDPSVLNLYDQDGQWGPADLTLVNSAQQSVRGSLIVDPSLQKITFIKSGGPLLPDTYTVNLFGGPNGFRTTGGAQLASNTSGNFTIQPPAANTVTLSVPDFTRGAGQAVGLSQSSIPISISRGQGVSGVNFELHYDPALLEIVNVATGSGINGASTYNIPSPGRLIVTVTSATEFASQSGPFTLVNLTATVPATAPYASKHILDLTSLHIYDASEDPQELPAIDDDGVHLAAYFGDANGSQTYNAPDATAAQQVIVGINSGLSAYRLADPYLIVDISGNGQVQSNDVTSIQQAIVGLPGAGIPPLPNVTTIVGGGPDPIVSLPQNLVASVGETITVPVELLVTEPTGITLAGADLAIEYDASVLELDQVTAGALMVGFGLSVNTTTPGVIRLSLGGGDVLSLGLGAQGVLANLQFTLVAGAGSSSSLNLLASNGSLQTALYDELDRALTLSPAPTNADDDWVDGLLEIRPASLSEHWSATDLVLASSEEF